MRAVDALEAALYSENEPRLDAAEDLLEELELWLDEHPLTVLRGRQRQQRQRGTLRYDVQPNKDDPEDYAG